METKVIPMPKVQSWKKRWREMQERRAGLVVSLGAMLVVSLFLNQWLISPGTLTMTGSGQRGIASVGLTADDYKNTIRWEREMAEQVASAKYNVAHLSTKPSLRDELLFGALGGHYGVQFDQGHVLSLDFNTAAGAALKVENREKFLNDYRGVWAVEFAQARLEHKDDQQEIYQLLGADSAQKGRALLGLDPEGHILSLKVIK